MPKQSNKWHADQLRFIEWLATPKMARSPKTQKQFAAQSKHDEGTLSDWKRLPGFMDDVNGLARTQLKDNLTDIYAALVKAATTGDVSAIKLAMEMSGEYTPRQKIDMDLSKLSDDELERLASGQGGG
jgi:hypothetical protein